ncbi:MAG: hypothetical protein ACM3ZC_02665 [Bacteroidota bacterium]
MLRNMDVEHAGSDHDDDGEREELLFPITEDSAEKLWARYRQRLVDAKKLKSGKAVVMHAACHTCGTRLLERGNDLKTVQESPGSGGLGGGSL